MVLDLIATLPEAVAEAALGEQVALAIILFCKEWLFLVVDLEEMAELVVLALAELQQEILRALPAL